MIISSLISILIMVLFAIAIPVLIGIYVYNDANRRGMNALLWTVVAVFAPSLIGFIIYLLVRGNYSDLKCPRCGTTVTENYAVCPGCGIKLKASCPNCSAPVEPGWKICPRCSTPLPDQYADVMVPRHAKDKTLRNILIAIVAIPVLLILLITAGMVGIRL